MKKYFMSVSTFLLAFGVLVGCNGVGDDQNYNNNDDLRDVRNPGLNDVTPRDVDFNDNNGNFNDNGRNLNDNYDRGVDNNNRGLNNVGDEFEPDLDEEPAEQRNDNRNNNDLRNIDDIGDDVNDNS
jgi:hypothetical protein